MPGTRLDSREKSMPSELSSVVHDSELVRRRVTECQRKMVGDRRRGRLLPFREYQAEYDDVADLCVEFFGKLAELEGVPPSSLASAMASPSVVVVEPAKAPARADERKTGPYILEGRLGRGWSGEVFLAHKADLPEVKYAIKHFVSVGRSEYFDILKREASVLAKLRGLASICQFVEFGIDRGIPFLVTSYVKGPTLEDCLRQTPGNVSEFPDREPSFVFDPDDPIAVLPGPASSLAEPVADPNDISTSVVTVPDAVIALPSAVPGDRPPPSGLRGRLARLRARVTDGIDRRRAQRADYPATAERIKDWIRFFELAARALGEAHRLGIVHRDLKPANVIINERGEPVVLDFGFALDSRDKFDSLDSMGILVGTVSCMSPEQLMENYLPVDARTDVWSLGVCMYRVFTGHHPFAHGILTNKAPLRAADKGVLFGEIMVKETDPPHRFNRSIPRMLEQVIMTCLQKDRDRRYRDGNELAEDLRRIRQGYPILKDRVPLARRYVLQFRRKPERTLLVTLACLILVGSASWGILRRFDAVNALKIAGPNLSPAEVTHKADFVIEATGHLVEEVKNLRKKKGDPTWDRELAVSLYHKGLALLDVESPYSAKFVELRGRFLHPYEKWVEGNAVVEERYLDALKAWNRVSPLPDSRPAKNELKAKVDDANRNRARARLNYELHRSDPPTYDGDHESEQADFKLRQLLRDVLPELRRETESLHADLNDLELARPQPVVVDPGLFPGPRE